MLWVIPQSLEEFSAAYIPNELSIKISLNPCEGDGDGAPVRCVQVMRGIDQSPHTKGVEVLEEAAQIKCLSVNNLEQIHCSHKSKAVVFITVLLF